MGFESTTSGSDLVSIITPVFRPRLDHLRACIDSVLQQTDPGWQLVLVDDASGDPVLTRVLESYADDPRVVLRTRAENGGIVAATNTALELATGKLIAFLDNDGVLAPEAISSVRRHHAANPTAEILYSDRGHIDEAGRPAGRHFRKPDWSPERLRGNMYLAHLTVVSRAAAEEVGGMRPDFEGSQDHDLVLRISERGYPVVHIPEILYFWRTVEGSTASDPDAKPYASTASVRAVAEHCDRLGIEASVGESVNAGFYVLRRRPPRGTRVSILIPTAGTRREVFGSERCLVVEAIRSIVGHTYEVDFEILVVHDRGDRVDYLEDAVRAGAGRVRLIAYDEPFNFSRKVNLGALHAAGDVLLLLNDDTEVIDPQWLDHLASLALEPGVGAVGAKLLYENRTVQHAGISVVPPGGMANVGQGAPDHGGHFGSFLVDHEVVAVTGACLAVRTTTFVSLGGLSEEFAGSFNDVDFCFKARQAGYRNISANSVRLYHFESLSRDPTVTDHEHATMLGRWRHQLKSDPYLRRVGVRQRKLRQRQTATTPEG